jgi:hypothetical protein
MKLDIALLWGKNPFSGNSNWIDSGGTFPNFLVLVPEFPQFPGSSTSQLKVKFLENYYNYFKIATIYELWNETIDLSIFGGRGVRNSYFCIFCDVIKVCSYTNIYCNICPNIKCDVALLVRSWTKVPWVPGSNPRCVG